MCIEHGHALCVLSMDMCAINENAPSAGTERIDRIGNCQSGLWDATFFSSKTTTCNHSS